ncbi:MAG: single-stranded-DNA-specific exonuclease RecJ, partial [Bacteroidota bacterium]
AVDRIVRAVTTNERILVYGDYDVDGTNGTTVLWTFLRSVGADAHYFIPDRQKEGYGLSNAGLARAREFQPSLIVTVDCGITAASQVEDAARMGIDVVICDHHEPGQGAPAAVAVLNPMQAHCAYPFKYLCGCGVAFKLVQALAMHPTLEQRLGNIEPDAILNYLQYVALATTADIVPLSGENRAIVKLGFDLINKNPLPGIQALIDVAGLTPGKITSGQAVFVLAPRINAVGRLGDARRAVALLACDSYGMAMDLAGVLERENTERRKIDEKTFQEAQELVEQRIKPSDTAIVLHQGTWHPGVIGIVASRLVERYYRPAIMMTTIDGVAKGSARSVSGFNIYEALKRCEDKLLQFGGHKYAAGLSVSLDRLEEFREAFRQVTDELLTVEMLTPEIRIDAEIPLNEVTPKFIRVLSQFAPFGPDNMRPVFAVRGVAVVGAPRIVGKNHLKFKVRKDAHVIDAIGFNLGHHIEAVRTAGNGIDLAFSLDESEYMGEFVPQLKIRDIKIRP